MELVRVFLMDTIFFSIEKKVIGRESRMKNKEPLTLNGLSTTSCDPAPHYALTLPLLQRLKKTEEKVRTWLWGVKA